MVHKGRIVWIIEYVVKRVEERINYYDDYLYSNFTNTYYTYSLIFILSFLI